jgi:hypothetical protein
MMSELDAQDRDELKDSQYAFPKERKEPLNDAKPAALGHE